MNGNRVNRRAAIIALAIVLAAFSAVVVAPVISFRCRMAKAATFCRTVEGLPQHILREYALQCHRLWSETAAQSPAESDINDTNILSRFMLAGALPESIYRNSYMLSVSYVESGRLAAFVNWIDCSQWGQHVWKLETHCGDTGGNVLFVKEK